MDPVLLIEDLVFRRHPPDGLVLQVPALRIEASQRLLIRGASGSGKSTLISLIAGVLLADQGLIRVNGQAWSSMRSSARDRWRGDHLGIVFQQFNLLPFLSALDNVLLPCQMSQCRRQRLGGKSMQEVARALLAGLDLAPQDWSRPAGQLSVGQQQRVAVARALIGQPGLLLADEPSSALDVDARDRFVRLLLQECDRVGSALLLVSHDPALDAYFERVLVLDGGRMHLTEPSR